MIQHTSVSCRSVVEDPIFLATSYGIKLRRKVKGHFMIQIIIIIMMMIIIIITTISKFSNLIGHQQA